MLQENNRTEFKAELNDKLEKEVVINAMVHSDFSREIPPVFEIFSDRMVFTSYGGLIPGQSEQDFFSCSSMPRNRELMRVFKDIGLVEQLGSGMSRILKMYDKSIFKISEHFIKVEFPFSMPKEQNIIASGNENGNENREEQKALEILRLQPAITAKEMVGKMGVSARTIGRIMKSLRDKEMISRVGSDKKGYWEIHEE